MLERVEAEIGQVGRFRMAENSEDAAFVLEFIHLGSYAARCLKYVSSAVSQIVSASCSATSITGLPATVIRSRPPPVVPISRAGTPAARARASSDSSCGR